MMTTSEILSVSFGLGGDSKKYETYGWSAPESGYTWSDGPAAGLDFPALPAPHGYFLELFAWPLDNVGKPQGRRINLSVNGIGVGTAFNFDRQRVAWYLPPLATSRMIINLDLPDAERPAGGHDDRLLSSAAISARLFSSSEPWRDGPAERVVLPPPADLVSAQERVRRITGLSADELIVQFESLGTNCEFGFVQRAVGAEPLGLFRFSSSIGHHLVSSLDSDFEDLGSAEFIDPVPEEAGMKDWVVYERKHWLRYHTWVLLENADRAEMIRRETKKLPFLLRKLREDLSAGEKTFVYHERRQLSVNEILPIFLAIRRRGQASLLVVQPADKAHPPGSVELVLPGLFMGYLSRFSDAPNNLSPLVHEWLMIAASIWLLRTGR